MGRDADEVRAALEHGSLLGTLSSVPQAAVIVARDGTVVWCNRAAVDLLHSESPDQILDRQVSSLSDPAGPDELAWAEQWEQLRQGRVCVGEVRTANLDGSHSRLRVLRSPVCDRDGAVIAALSLAVDPIGEIRAREALEASEERIRALSRYSSDIAIVASPSGRIVFVSPSIERVGWRPEDLVGKDAWSFIHPDDVAADRVEVEAALAEGRTITREWRMRRADGSYGWFEQTLTNLSHVPAIGGIVGNFRDVTERHEADEARRESEVVLRRVIEATSDAYLGIDHDGVLTEWNRAASQMFGWTEADAVGRELAGLIVPEEDRPVFRLRFGRVARGEDGQFLQRPFEMVALSRSGRRFPVEVSVVQVKVRDHLYFRAFVRDIAERKEAEARLAHQALTDSLTSLPNRTLLRDRLARAVGRIGRHGGLVAVMFLDLDRFKLVNDGLGHDAGDELLVEVARRVRVAVRNTDTVARYGGDEFVVVMEEVASLEDVLAVADRILDSVRQPVLLAGREVRPRVSIGVAATDDGTSLPDNLVRDADLAMYRAKERGGQCTEVFEAVMDSRAIVRFELERDLRTAIETTRAVSPPASGAIAPAGRLELHYQPIYTLDGPLVGLEALVRWEHPSFGTMAPVEFIPLAEETGLIVPLGEYVLEEATRQLALWRREVSPSLSVSANISARQLDDPGLPLFVASLLERYDLDPEALCLELTETALLRDSGAAVLALEELRRLGVRLAVDDFGTGYSSLVYLRRFPVQIVKLDRSFVSGVPSNRQDAAIVAAVIDLAHALGMEAVAEGVETSEQKAALAMLGCELGQGYLWSPPRPEEHISALLRELATASVSEQRSASSS
jgi:diguanylate cyclase (GGDEF)-like protein/PAS domain S-box-containing protein